MSKFIKKSILPIMLLGVLLVIIYYRAFLFTADFNSPVNAVVDEVSDSLGVNIPAHKIAENEKPVYDQIFGDASGEKILPAPTDMQADVLDAPVNQTEIAIEIDSESANLNVDDIVLAVKETVNEALEIFKEENQQDSSSQLVDKQSILTESELLFKARLAYWNRDLKTAEETYIALTELADDPNAYGELGNIYYMQSKWKKASEAYYHAAIKLKSINQIDKAYHLLRIIRGLDSITANKLQLELQQSS